MPRVEERPKKEVVVQLKNVYFPLDRWTPRPESLPTLGRLAEILRQYPTLTIRVEGHTDNLGDARYNLHLSRKRAEAVRDYLIQAGIARQRIVAVGLGSQRPLASNDTGEGRRRNRRVEVHFTSDLPEQLRIQILRMEF